MAELLKVALAYDKSDGFPLWKMLDRTTSYD